MSKKRVAGMLLAIFLIILLGSCLLYAYLYNGHDLASQTRMVERACREEVMLYSATIINPVTPESFKNSFGDEKSVEIMELHAADGQHGYAVFIPDGKGHKDLQSTYLYDRDVAVGFYTTEAQMYGIFMCRKHDLEKLAVTVTDHDTGEVFQEEYDMNGYQIHVAELPFYKSCTVDSKFYDIHGNCFE